MKKFLISMACIFGILTVILYFASINKLDSSSARYLGVTETINIQGTVFCAACAIICALNVVGAIILNYLETYNNSININNPNLSYTANTSSNSALNSLVKDAERKQLLEAEEIRNRRILEEGGWKCTCGRTNFAYVSTCACGKNKREVMYQENHVDSSSGADNVANAAKINEDSDWIDDGPNFVKCPNCNNRMSIDFIKARRKCPECGKEYNVEHNL